jgi:P27 family predicted phage terminase small subunit
MKNSGPSPPNGLSAAAKRHWREIQAEYGIEDPGGLMVLAAACEAYDRMREAQALLKAEGLTTKDRFGQARAHPAVIIERDSRGQMLSAIKQLNLDLEPLKDRGRPSGTPAFLLRKV